MAAEKAEIIGMAVDGTIVGAQYAKGVEKMLDRLRRLAEDSNRHLDIHTSRPLLGARRSIADQPSYENQTHRHAHCL
jgi:hypothetical protein